MWYEISVSTSCIFSLLGFVFDLAKRLDMKEINSRPYHPQSQGHIARGNKNLNTIFSKAIVSDVFLVIFRSMF